MTAGYSGTPLSKKLGIRAGSRVILLDAPEGFESLLSPLPDDVNVHRPVRVPRGPCEIILRFVTARGTLERHIEALARAVFPDGAVWVAWPKRASGVPTDMTEDEVRALALPLGLVDNKVCAIDETWSGLRLVHRRERRGR